MGKPILVVATVLLNEDGHILMGLRSDCLKWEVPGGKVDEESILDAFHRELLEETGIVSNDIPQLIGLSEPSLDLQGGKRFCIFFFSIRSWKGFAQRREPDKCLIWRWFSADELPPIDSLSPGTQDFVRYMLPVLLQQREDDHEMGDDDCPDDEFADDPIAG